MTAGGTCPPCEQLCQASNTQILADNCRIDHVGETAHRRRWSCSGTAELTIRKIAPMQDSSTSQGEVPGRLRDGNGGATQSFAVDSSAIDPYLHDQARWVGSRSRDDAESVSTYSSASTWTKFLQQYSFNYEPDYCLKVRKR